MVKLGPFNYLGVDSLIKEAGTYVPDFSAKVINKARVLRITRSQYEKVVKN